MLREIIRDSFGGQIIYHLSGRRVLTYPEDRPDFVVPARYLPKPPISTTISSTSPSTTTTITPDTDDLNSPSIIPTSPSTSPHKEISSSTPSSSKTSHGNINPSILEESDIVDWYTSHDPENPYNWSLSKKIWLVLCVMIMTTTVYMASSIWAPAIIIGADYFNISPIVSTLGISFFVLGYAVGPLFLSPITEIPRVGRTAPYIITLGLFCIIQIPNALVDNYAGFLVLRWLSGFIGSPPLATGGASLGDILAPHKLPYAMGLYGVAAAAAPGLGPVISAFAVEAKGWRWAFWEMAWFSGATLIVLAFFMPETSSDTILYRRAVRLRRITSNPHLKSHSEIAQAHLQPSTIVFDALIRPLTMTVTEPIIMGVNLYIGLLYAVLYSFLESFQLVYGEGGYGWSLGVSTLPFLGPMVGEFLGFLAYAAWNRYYYEGTYLRAKGNIKPEQTLPMSIPGALVFPITLFWFAWSANRTHWIVPVLAGTVFGMATDWLFTPFLTYIAYAYPKYAASALASNDFFRSIMGAAMPVVSQPLFHNLGIAWGNTIIACCAVLFIPLPFILIKAGPWLRSKSPMAVHDDEIQPSPTSSSGRVSEDGGETAVARKAESQEPFKTVGERFVSEQEQGISHTQRGVGGHRG